MIFIIAAKYALLAVVLSGVAIAVVRLIDAWLDGKP
jgi:Flp pilus assembly pilin Flp